MTEALLDIDLLVVDDDDDFRSTVVRRFRRRGFRVSEASGGEEALALAQRRQFDVAVIDMVMPGMSGLELLRALDKAHADCETIVLTGQGTIETAVETMKLGAFDYLRKPFPLADLEVIIQKAYQHHRMACENRQLRTVLERSQPSDEIIGNSTPLMEVFRLIERAGPTDKAILIQGESGTGKELVAQALHRASSRADRPMVVINCAALPESLLESELFGHEKGAFTGAIGTKQGLFELADGGTLLIDEIGEMPASLQAKLLRVLDDGSMRRVGSVKERRVDVRVLAATNRNMAEQVRLGKFREDLYYRINVMSLDLPPLRERRGDIPILVRHFAGPDWAVEANALQAMESYDWPGNIRQLINAIDRAKILADGPTIRRGDLPHEVAYAMDNRRTNGETGPSDALATLERSHIVDILRRENGNKARAARVLGVNRRSLYRMLDKYAIAAAEVSASP